MDSQTKKTEYIIKAGLCFEKADELIMAVACFFTAHEFSRAGHCLENMKEIRKAGKCYFMGGDYRKALVCFESTDDFLNVAECYTRLGMYYRAGEIYETGCKDYVRAIDSYEQFSTIHHNNIDYTIAVNIRLAGCFHLTDNLKSESDRFLMSRKLIKKKETRDLIVHGRCYELMGRYGALINRNDLIIEGFEKAIRFYKDQSSTDKINLLYRDYLEITNDLNNKALARRIKEEWSEFSDQETEIKNESYEDDLIIDELNEEMVLIPGGEFTIGTQNIYQSVRSADIPEMLAKQYGGDAEEYKDERQENKVATSYSYYIDRYPVTNIEYKLFVDATGYPPPRSLGRK